MSVQVAVRTASTTEDVDDALRRALIDCWVAVTRIGGAAGFPFPDTGREVIARAFHALVADLALVGSRLIYAEVMGEPVGWVYVQRNAAPVVSHWGLVKHLQSDPHWRRRGIGTALMRSARDAGREMGLEHLQLAVRDGEGLEAFYRSLGWETVGRWPRALRLSTTDTRDEVLMRIDLPEATPAH